MATLTCRKVAISLEAGCVSPACSDLAFRFKKQLDVPKYSRGVSLLSVPSTLNCWRSEHRTARKRADRASRRGYEFASVDYSQHNDAIHDINTSKQIRQGRPMSAGYLERHNHGPLPDQPCPRHRIHTFGMLKNSVLRAYLTLYRVGELALVSMILGHGDCLDDDVMYGLFGGVVAEQAGQGGTFFYNRHDSGEDGLRFFKERLGFTEGDVEWRLH